MPRVVDWNFTTRALLLLRRNTRAPNAVARIWNVAEHSQFAMEHIRKVEDIYPFSENCSKTSSLTGAMMEEQSKEKTFSDGPDWLSRLETYQYEIERVASFYRLILTQTKLKSSLLNKWWMLTLVSACRLVITIGLLAKNLLKRAALSARSNGLAYEIVINSILHCLPDGRKYHAHASLGHGTCLLWT